MDLGKMDRRGLMLRAGAAGAGLLATRAIASEPQFEILAEGLAFPEGPVVMPDGSVIMVELIGGRITRAWNGKTEVVCEIGGGPNGAQIGPDGALYVCNSGGADANNHSLADPSQPGRIERVDLSTGKVDRLYEVVDGRTLSAPNDLVFDAQGGMWLTDFGKVLEESFMRGGIYYATPDGNRIEAVTRHGTGFNGIGLSPDGNDLYFAMNYSGHLYRMEITGSGEVAKVAGTAKPAMEFVGSAFGGAHFDGLAVTKGGNVCLGTNFGGGITTISPTGDVSFLPLPELMVTNIAFGGNDMRDAYMTWSTRGYLVRMRWPEEGLALNFQ